MIIRDPIHGDVELSDLEAAVLDLPAVQRLRAVKQLGTAYLVYPSAQHTRFEHSLGVAAAAHRILDALARRGHRISDRTRALVGAAAILHDVTHVPFGHTLEDERRLFPRHDKGGRLARLLEGSLGEGLARLGVREEVAALLGAAPPRHPPWLMEVVASTIDADLLDYLRRDAYFCGLAATYDARVLRYFDLADGHLALHMARHGMDRPDAWSEVVALLRMRYFLTERVYYHHTKVVAGAMISKAVELAVDGGWLDESDLLELGDWTLLEKLCGLPHEGIRRLILGVRERRLLKRGLVTSPRSVDEQTRRSLVERFHEQRGPRRQVEETLARELGCQPDQVVLYCPALTVMKEAAARVITPAGMGFLNDPKLAGSEEIHAMERRYAELWRLYVFVPAPHASQAAVAAARLLGVPNEYRSDRLPARGPGLS